jgi:glycosyltransferase involved in cell wall biosynthesis
MRVSVGDHLNAADILSRMKRLAGETVAKLEIALPERVVVGRGNAFVIGGYCYHPHKTTRRLEVEVAGFRQPVARHNLPREDVFSVANGANPASAYRSGFVAMPRVAPVSASVDANVALILTLRRGEQVRAPLGTVKLDPELAAPADASVARFEGDGARVAICMATYNPPPDLLRYQLDSLRRESHTNWVCLISDDNSDPDRFATLRAEIEGDPRFVLSRSDRRLGFYRNFERALAMAPPEAEFVTLCDQDDRWHPDKLERLLAAMQPETELVYSDARVIRPDGELVHPSYWTARRNNHTNFASLLLANSVTGAAALFRRDLLDDALPLPQRLGRGFHDHWLAIVALARGRIDYIDAPLYDYVQHEGAVIGHATANKRPRPVRRHLIDRLRNPGDGGRVAYYYDWYQQLLFAEVLRIRSWERMTASKRRTLRRLLGADDGVIGVSWLLARRLRRFWGHDETLDRELLYAYALLRRRAVSAWTLGRRRPGRWLSRDASIPPPPTTEGSV